GRAFVTIAGVFLRILVVIILFLFFLSFFRFVLVVIRLSFGRANQSVIGHYIIYIAVPSILAAYIDIVVPIAGPVVSSVPSVQPDMGIVYIDVEPVVLIDVVIDKDMAAYRDGNGYQYLLITKFLTAGDGK